jgi:hypothetical protein
MAHPLTDKLAAAMHAADGSPAKLANGQPAASLYRAWADCALAALVEMAERDGDQVLLTELGAISERDGRGETSDQLTGLQARLVRDAS